MAKAKVTLAGIPLAGSGSIAWRYQTGTNPYLTTFSVHTSEWNRSLKNKMGTPLTLKIVDSRGVTNTIKGVYILHSAPGDGPKRTSFLVADRRWKWAYPLIVRDYNIAKKSGDKTQVKNTLKDIPLPGTTVRDVFDFKPYSLKNAERKWTAEEAVIDVLEQLEPGTKNKAGETVSKGYIIESFPIADGGADGQFTLQNVTLRDQGDVALARLLSYIPAAAVYIDKNSKVRVIDQADYQGMESYYKSFKFQTWDGDKPEFVDRKAIRPAVIRVHYQREIEAVFEYSDDAFTSVAADENAPSLENVLPTVDPSTTVTHGGVEHDVAAGTWEEFWIWLKAMDDDKPAGAHAWTFRYIRQIWMSGQFEGILGGDPLKPFDGLVKNTDQNIPARVEALKAHFRQTFRINPKYTDRLRDIMDTRVGVLDAVTGARAKAAVFGQICLVPTIKGQQMSARTNPDKNPIYLNIDTLPADGETLLTASPGPSELLMKDRDLGIFTIKHLLGPYGTVGSVIPCHLSGANNQPGVPIRDLERQDTHIMGPGFRIVGKGNGLLLKNSMKMKVILTVVLGAPNNKSQMHVVEVEAKEIKKLFRREYRIQNGQGPVLDVFVPPTEMTARFQLIDEEKAREGMIELLGLEGDPTTAGLVDDPETEDVDESLLVERGWIISNAQNELADHSKAVAAEALSVFADNLEGSVATAMLPAGGKLVGNMSGAAVQVSSAPSAKVNMLHDFPGQTIPISRFALMSQPVRTMSLGIIPFGDER